jgi:hypothetical protein
MILAKGGLSSLLPDLPSGFLYIKNVNTSTSVSKSVLGAFGW